MSYDAQLRVPTSTSVGDVLREWRTRRRLSQLNLALDTGISARHLSFVESGRSAPSRDVLIRLARTLSLPRRAANRLMLAAGYAPVYAEAGFETAEMDLVRETVQTILDAQMPYPALAVDGHWTLVRANQALLHWVKRVDPDLLQPPVNVLRLSFHPKGLAPYIVNFQEWRYHVLERLQIQFAASGDTALSRLEYELTAYPQPFPQHPTSDELNTILAVPLRLKLPDCEQVQSFVSTTTVFSTATSVTVSELALESFYPADELTRRLLLKQQAIPSSYNEEVLHAALTSR